MAESDKENETLQAIPHSSSDELNKKMRQNELSKSLEFYLIKNPEIDQLINFIYPEDTDIEIQQSHEKFLEYLRTRMGSFGSDI